MDLRASYIIHLSKYVLFMHMIKLSTNHWISASINGYSPWQSSPVNEHYLVINHYQLRLSIVFFPWIVSIINGYTQWSTYDSSTLMTINWYQQWWMGISNYHKSADPCLRQGRGGAWDRRRREACRWLCTGFALAIADWACHRFFGRLGHKVIGLTACNPDVWPPSNPSRQGTVATGSARGLKTWPTGCRLWHNGLFFTGFQSGRLAALKPFPAGYGCHWLC